MNDILFNIIYVVVIVIIGWISKYGIQLLKVKLEDSKFKGLVDIIEKVVSAAEQLGKVGTIKKKEKKQWVIDLLKESYGDRIKGLTDKQLSALIEGVVNELFGDTNSSSINASVDAVADKVSKEIKISLDKILGLEDENIQENIEVIEDNELF